MYGIFQSTKFPYPGTEKGHRPSGLIARHPEQVQTVLKPYLAELFKITGVEQAYAVVDGTPGNARIQRRGEVKDLGDEVPRGFLQIAGGKAPRSFRAADD